VFPGTKGPNQIFELNHQFVFAATAAMPRDDINLDTFASNKDDGTFGASSLEGSRYDPDNAELTRLGKKPVLKVCSLHFERKLAYLSAKFWLYFYAGFCVYGDDYMGRRFIVRRPKILNSMMLTY
jgi:hypothetical protein